MEWSWKIRNLSLYRKIFEHCHFVQNFPPGSDIENSNRPFSIRLRDFFLQLVLEICNLSLCITHFIKPYRDLDFGKVLWNWLKKNIWTLSFFQNFPPVSEMILKFHKWFGGCLKIFPLDFQGSLFYIIKYIRLNIGPGVRLPVSPSVIGICNPLLNRSRVLGLFNVNKNW